MGITIDYIPETTVILVINSIDVTEADLILGTKMGNLARHCCLHTLKTTGAINYQWDSESG